MHDFRFTFFPQNLFNFNSKSEITGKILLTEIFIFPGSQNSRKNLSPYYRQTRLRLILI